MIPVRDTIPSRNPPLAVYALIALNALAFAFEPTVPRAELIRLFYLLGAVPARYADPACAEWAGFPAGDYRPFLSGMFLHGGRAHLLGNMWALWIFGDNVEDRLGSLRFGLFYLACGVAAGVVHCWADPNSTLPTVGASGAIAGVMGIYFVLFPRSRVIAMVPILLLPVFVELPALLYLFAWLLTQVQGGLLTLVGPRLVGGVAWWAHLGGFRGDRPVSPVPAAEHGIESDW